MGNSLLLLMADYFGGIEPAFEKQSRILGSVLPTRGCEVLTSDIELTTIEYKVCNILSRGYMSNFFTLPSAFLLLEVYVLVGGVSSIVVGRPILFSTFTHPAHRHLIFPPHAPPTCCSHSGQCLNTTSDPVNVTCVTASPSLFSAN